MENFTVRSRGVSKFTKVSQRAPVSTVGFDILSRKGNFFILIY